METLKLWLLMVAFVVVSVPELLSPDPTLLEGLYP